MLNYNKFNIRLNIYYIFLRFYLYFSFKEWGHLLIVFGGGWMGVEKRFDLIVIL